jgi:hypothetical protein
VFYLYRSLCLVLLLTTLGCNDDCPNGQCPPQATPNPFADQPTYQPAQPWLHDSTSMGREIVGAPATLINHAAASEEKSGCPCASPQFARPPVQSQSTIQLPVTTIPWQTHRIIGPPIYLAPGERLIKVNPLPSVVTSQPSSIASQPTMPLANASPQRCECPDCKCLDCTGPGCGCCADCPPGQCTTGNCSAVGTPDDQIPREGVFSCQRCKRPTVGAQWHELWAADDTSLTCLCESCWRSLSPDQRSTELQKYARERSRGELSPVVSDAIREAVGQ